MAEFKDIFSELRKSRKYTQNDVAKLLDVSISTIAMWETGKRTPTRVKYEAISDLFNVDLDYLYGKTTVKRKVIYDEFGNKYSPAPLQPTTNNPRLIPVYGSVPAGIPIEAIEDIIDYEEITEEMARCGEYFGLIIKGDSMIPDLKEKDVVIVRKQEDAESRDIVIALVNGNDACCKRLMKYAGGVQLLSNNPAYEPMMFTYDEDNPEPIRIIGKVVESRRKY